MARDKKKPGEGVFVSSGTFLVDRRKALEKLSLYQTPDPALFMLPWVRAAVSAGATRVEMSVARDGSFAMSFDGRPFTATELRDPYACLLDAAPAEPRRRDLATGILAALRLRPLSITVSSGAAGARHRLRVDRTDQDQFGPCESEGSDTVLWVLIRDRSLPRTDWHVQVLERCRAAPLTLKIAGVEEPPFEGDAGIGIGVKEGPLRVWLEVPPELKPPPLDISKRGVRICQVDREWLLAPAGGFVNHDEFSVDASQVGLVRDDVAEAALAAVDRAAESLLRRMADTQRGRLQELEPWLSRPKWLEAWKERVENGPSVELSRGAFLFPGNRLARTEEEWAALDRVYISARITAWLKRARRKIRTNRREPVAGLRDAPLGLDRTGRPVLD